MEKNWATTGTITKIPTQVLATLPNPIPTHPTHNPRGGGYSDIFIRRLGSIFGVKILNYNNFWGLQKNKYFFGVMKFLGYFLGSSLNWTIFRGHFFAF